MRVGPGYRRDAQAQPRTDGTLFRLDKLDQREIARPVAPDYFVLAVEAPAAFAAIPRKPHLPSLADGTRAVGIVPQRMGRGQEQIFRHQPTAAKPGVLVLYLRDVGLQLRQIVRHRSGLSGGA